MFMIAIRWLTGIGSLDRSILGGLLKLSTKMLFRNLNWSVILSFNIN